MTSRALYAAYLLQHGKAVLSSEEVKQIRSTVDQKDLAAAIMSRARQTGFNDHDLDILEEVTGWHGPEEEGSLEAYANHIINYRYNYNPEALKVDPNMDLSKEHIGPMAEDIEKVNPAVVDVDIKSGYKTVNTGRLALMNAGAIAELARQIQELKDGR